MNRHDRRRAASLGVDPCDIESISMRHPGRCSYCERAFIHGSITMIGHTADGTLHVVGECCSSKLVSLLGGGVFLIPEMSSMQGRKRAQ
jgi:hypothetical protein